MTTTPTPSANDNAARTTPRRAWHRKSDKWQVRVEHGGMASCRSRPLFDGSGWSVTFIRGRKGFAKNPRGTLPITAEQARTSLRRIVDDA
jgi:hypothetical protein